MAAVASAVAAVAAATAATATTAAMAATAVTAASAVMVAPTTAEAVANVVAMVAAADADATVQWQGQIVSDTTSQVKYNLNFCGNTLLCFSKTLLCFLLLGLFVRYQRETISRAAMQKNFLGNQY